MFSSKNREQKITDAQEVHNRNLHEAEEHRSNGKRQETEFRRRWRSAPTTDGDLNTLHIPPEVGRRYNNEVRKRRQEEQERLDNAVRKSGQTLAEAKRRWRI